MKKFSAMTAGQQSTADSDLWRLEAGQPLPMVIGSGARVLRLVEGRLWVTVERADGEPPEDLWLQAGDALPLRAGARLLADAHPRASFRLTVPPPSDKGLLQRARRALRARRSADRFAPLAAAT